MSSSSVLSPNKRQRKHSNQEFLSLMIATKRLPSSSYQKITELNLSNLQLVQIESFPFKSLPNLISLDLSYNQLVSIQPDWSEDQPNHIEKLNLIHNKLETFLFLKDFHSLKWLNISENLLRTTSERCLILSICSKLEHLIDGNEEQLDDDQVKLDQWLQLMETKIDRLWTISYHDKYQQEKCNPIAKNLLDDFRHAMIKIFEKQTNFSQIHLSPLAKYLFDRKIDELCSSTTRRTLKTHLTADFNQLLEKKNPFELRKYLRCHQSDDQDLLNVPVRMCAFEPNSTSPILATCGGQKVCFLDCQTGEVTHLYEVSSLRSTAMPIGRKGKEKSKEYFSCLCWIEISGEKENFKVLAVGASNGHIYLLSAKWKIMFGHIELANSSISCLTWHSNDPSILVIGSFQTVRLVNIQNYLDRFQTFVQKQNQISTNSSDMKISIKETYHLDGSNLSITNFFIYPMEDEKSSSILFVGTTSGLFVIRDQSPMRISFPKSMCTVGEQIECLRLIDSRTHLMAMTILGLDQICCFDLKQTLSNQQLAVCTTFGNPYRQIPCQMSSATTVDENGTSFELILGSDNGTVYYHQIRMHSTMKKNNKFTFDHKRSEWNSLTSSSIVCSALHDQYLCLTSNNNLICIYKRQ